MALRSPPQSPDGRVGRDGLKGGAGGTSLLLRVALVHVGAFRFELVDGLSERYETPL